MKNKLIAFLMAVAMTAASNSQASAVSSCYFYVGGASGRLIFRNDGDTTLTATGGDYGMVNVSVPAHGWRYVGWSDDTVEAIDSNGNVVCGWYPNAKG